MIVTPKKGHGMSKDLWIDGAMQVTFCAGPKGTPMVQLNWDAKYIVIPLEILYHLMVDPGVIREVQTRWPSGT